MRVRRGRRDLRVETPTPADLLPAARGPVEPLVLDLGPRAPLACCGGLWGPLGRGTARQARHRPGCPVAAAR